ncbi:PAS sensor protein [Streptomyces agglomeratus]|uniref:SpoIIE family protein phosphatase n=1 Tax=Streptomyces agglomeratus TaxID=285458 RepID=UPI0008525AC3|nr:SpoIIE family protein phosphatase [Streptomyces agglomeratus]OEJ37539.1 PAS sensor protein [Streptomyces agglomeratus]OEJ48076.1 PAS sensor protein [Streptomyces agglomeratus]
MRATEPVPAHPGRPGGAPSTPGGLLDLLSVAAVVLDAQGRIVLWSPQAEDLFGYSAEEALGRFAGRLLVQEQHLELVDGLFEQVMAGGAGWAGVFPMRHRDGSTRLVEFRNMRLEDDRKDLYALGLATDQATLHSLERDLALSTRLVSQSPIGLAVVDTDLRYVTVNPALERINGLSAAEHVGRSVREALPFLDTESIEAAMREVLADGVPIVDRESVGRTPADPDEEKAWSVSFYRLEGSSGKVLGVATSVVDVTERRRATIEASQARQRLALVADASIRIGTTLDLDETARELADVSVPELADVAAVDVLDSVLNGRSPVTAHSGPAVFRALAVASAYPSEAVRAADPPGEVARYEADRLVTRCVNTGRPVRVSHVSGDDLLCIARSPEAAGLLHAAGLHSYLAVPLIARGKVLGALDLKRTRNQEPFSADDEVLAGELAARAAVCIDNARWYRQARNTALTLQRSLLPERPPHQPGLEIASRYQPAQLADEVGGDWFDVIPLTGDKSALVVGDVMGSGISAAATMGQLRTATRTLAELDLAPDQVLHHLDRITDRMGQTITTCIYAVYDPHEGRCVLSNAGHMAPVLIRPGRAPELLDLPTGAPLGVGQVTFHTTTLALNPGDSLVLYTDGLVETRDQAIDERLDALLAHLSAPSGSLEETCDLLLHALRHPGDHDDVALLIARATAMSG